MVCIRGTRKVLVNYFANKIYLPLIVAWTTWKMHYQMPKQSGLYVKNQDYILHGVAILFFYEVYYCLIYMILIFWWNEWLKYQNLVNI